MESLREDEWINGDQALQDDITFEIEDDEEVMKIYGNLVSIKKDKVGVEWEKVQGNEFWLTSIIGQLNRELKALA